jgi:aldehyde:ferredoxin oxidoreductase
MDECFEIGERAHQLRHVFNLREGLNPLEFKLPDRIVGRPPFQEGAVKDITIDVREVAREFIQAVAWDPVTARPSRHRLISLGLGNLAQDLYAGVKTQ